MNFIEIEQTFQKYQKRLLEKRELAKPDGRPLYAYRITTEEFDEIEGILRKRMDFFQMLGRRLWVDCRPFRTVFLGEPVLYRTTGEDTRKPVSGKISWKEMGSTAPREKHRKPLRPWPRQSAFPILANGKSR